MGRHEILKKSKPFGLLAVLASATVALLAMTPTLSATPGVVVANTPAPLTLITMFRPLSATVSSSDQECTGAPLITTTGTFDNVVVPEGQDCRITGSLVRGNIKVLADATLDARENDIRGSVQGDKPEFVELWNNTIGGNVEMVEATGANPNGSFFACGNTLEQGNIAIEKSRSGTIQIGTAAEGCGNTLGHGNVFVQENTLTPNDFFNVNSNDVEEGNLQVFKNVGGFARLVQNNIVRKGVIQCRENTTPFTGTPNAGRADPPPNQCTGGPLP